MPLNRPAFIFFLALAFAFAGCATDHAPTAADLDSMEPAAKKGRGQGKTKTTGSTETSTTESSTTESSTTESSTADLSADEARSISEWVSPKGKARLKLQDLNGSGIYDDMYALLWVPNGAVTERVLVTMTLYGNYLSDVIVAFQPGGLEFAKDAILEVYVGRDLVDLDMATLTVWHEYEDGTIEEVTLDWVKNYGAGAVTFEALLPGFSRYGLRRSR